MTEPETEADLSRFRRVLVASCGAVCVRLLASRLVYLQVYRHADLNEQVEQPHAVVPIVPNRG
jgi:penicillin-binding protein 2